MFYVKCDSEIKREATIKYLETLGYNFVAYKADYRIEPNIYVNSQTNNFCTSKADTESWKKLEEILPVEPELTFEGQTFNIGKDIRLGEITIPHDTVKKIIELWRGQPSMGLFRLLYQSKEQRNAIVAYLEALGYKKSVHADPLVDDEESTNIVVTSDGIIEPGHLKDFIIPLSEVGPFVQPIKINGYDVIKRDDCLKIGCKTLPKDLVEKIIKRFE